MMSDRPGLWTEYSVKPTHRDGLNVWRLTAFLHDGEKRNVDEEVMFCWGPPGTDDYRMTFEWLDVKIRRKADRYIEKALPA